MTAENSEIPSSDSRVDSREEGNGGGKVKTALYPRLAGDSSSIFDHTPRFGGIRRSPSGTRKESFLPLFPRGG